MIAVLRVSERTSLSEPLLRAMSAIHHCDPSFEPGGFLDGSLAFPLSSDQHSSSYGEKWSIMKPPTQGQRDSVYSVLEAEELKNA